MSFSNSNKYVHRSRYLVLLFKNLLQAIKRTNLQVKVKNLEHLHQINMKVVELRTMILHPVLFVYNFTCCTRF